MNHDFLAFNSNQIHTSVHTYGVDVTSVKILSFLTSSTQNSKCCGKDSNIVSEFPMFRPCNNNGVLSDSAKVTLEQSFCNSNQVKGSPLFGMIRAKKPRNGFLTKRPHTPLICMSVGNLSNSKSKQSLLYDKMQLGSSV